MKQIVSETEAKLTYLKRELAKSITHSKFFNQKTCTYDPPARAIPAKVRRLIAEIQKLETELEREERNNGHRCRS